MSHLALRRLIGAAIFDRDLFDGLMNGKRSALMTEFDLSDDERRVVASFESESVWELATTVHAWLIDEHPSTSIEVDASAF